MKERVQAAILWLVLCVFARASFPQEKSTGAVLKQEVNLVLMDVTVRDSKGKLLTDLRKEDFALQEDGTTKAIQYFSQDELPLAVALVLDRSGSMKPSFAQLRQSVTKALSVLRPDDRAVLFSFARKPQRLTDLTADKNQIAAAVAGVKAGGGTNILDTLYRVSGYLKAEAPNERRAIILISDNIAPRFEKHSQGNVIEAAIENETEIHSLCTCEGPARWALGGLVLRGFIVNMKHVTEETGGKVVETGKDQRLIDGLSDTLLRLRRCYAVGYYALQIRESGRFHKVRITLTSEHGVVGADYFISARRGYYEPKGQSETHE
jgi:VWFA-related protein